MGVSSIPSFCLQPQKIHSLLNQLFMLLLLLLPHANSVSFNFPSFQPNMLEITYEGDAFAKPGVIELTKNQQEGNLTWSVGRASYAKPVILRDDSTGRLADFTTHFSFVMTQVPPSPPGDGLSFFIAPFESRIPKRSNGGFLGLVDGDTASDPSSNQIVAVEFDTYKNEQDPSNNHVGINVNSIESVANVTAKINLTNGSTVHAWVSYNSNTKKLSVFLSNATNEFFNENLVLSHTVDFTIVLGENVSVGFSAATGTSFELHTIHSWSFNSTLDTGDGNMTKTEDRKKKNKMGLVIGLVVGLGGLICGLIGGLGFSWFIFWRKRVGRNEDLGGDTYMDYEFEEGTRPRKFTKYELIHATNNFAEQGKLGEGGFGGVYKGLLRESNIEVAVKRISKGSRQGKKEYMSEVRIISRLRHGNLVQLFGWCHEQSEFLLVYEYMSNGSLDHHLFGGKPTLTWPLRYKIAFGLASALHYLHEECDQRVLHRDIKASNVMLDANFNAKLGDFGLARLVNLELSSRTTVLAGTWGYLAPECAATSKASKKSDVYSFGVVCLEIACGQKAVEPRAGASNVSLVEWVWELYGKGQLLEAIDQKLGGEFDEREIVCLMVVGLWCCHANPNIRPSTRQVINILSFEIPLPNLLSYFSGADVICASNAQS